jgi:DmsE family decaheme c-type cytochrome
MGYALAQPPFQKKMECMECHDDVESSVVLTAHSHLNQVNCTDCHTVDEEHFDDPTVDNVTTPSGMAGNPTCLTCHAQKKPTMTTLQNPHTLASVSCTDCHSAHKRPKPDQPQREIAAVTVCLECHTDHLLDEGKAFGHPVGTSGITCASCHDPHQAISLQNRQQRQDACLACHREKRGPFVYEHLNFISGDCLDCHEVHGSNNPMHLTRNHVAQLCLECHTATLSLLGSQPPATHDLRSPRFQNCTTCHTAIHGSNRSPLLLK